MIDALYIGATGMQAQQMNVDVVANNLANVSTPGFKKNRITFQDAYYRAISSDNNLSSPPDSSIVLGLGTKVTGNTKSFVQGDLKASDSPLDIAIRGNGFFEVVMPDGSSAYTRYGALKVNENGVLSTASGYELKQQIEVPADAQEVVIDSKGLVSARMQNDNNLVELGQLELSSFPNESGLSAQGDNLYLATDSSGQPTVGIPSEQGLGSIAQGYLESSNVKLADEMVNLVLAQRAYELNAKVIQTADDMLAISNNLRK